MKNRIYSKKNQISDLILLLFIQIIIFATVCAVLVFVYSFFIKNNSYFRLVVIPDKSAVPIESEIQDGTVIDNVDKPLEKLPLIRYETQWATINVEGWKKADIPLYFGDNRAILAKGAGLWNGSKFCGQGEKIVVSAHVTSDFYEIEDTEIGDIVTIDTIYGKYEYRVKDIVIFNYKDPTLISTASEEEELVMYTCYPRENGFAFKTERIALVCEKISGKEYAK